jgi:hypothetical protein
MLTNSERNYEQAMGVRMNRKSYVIDVVQKMNNTRDRQHVRMHPSRAARSSVSAISVRFSRAFVCLTFPLCNYRTLEKIQHIRGIQ